MNKPSTSPPPPRKTPLLQPQQLPLKASFLEGVMVSRFKDAFGKKSIDVPLLLVLHEIQDGIYREQVEILRQQYQAWKTITDEDQKREAGEIYDKAKKLLPAFTISGTCSDRKTPVKHSGVLQVDCDGLGNQLDDLRARLKSDPYVCFGFKSPSGDGLKLGIRIDGSRHAEAFRAVEAYFLHTYRVTVDTRVKDPLRLCFVSHDPDLWTKEHPELMSIQPNSKLVDNGLLLETATSNLPSKPLVPPIGPCLGPVTEPQALGPGTDTMGVGSLCSVSLFLASPNSSPADPEFRACVEQAVSDGIADGGGNHSDITPRCAGFFFSRWKMGRSLSRPQQTYFAERFYQKLKTRGLATKMKTHYTSDMIATLNNPKMKSSNPVPAALVRARAGDTTPDLRSAEQFFEDESGERDEELTLYLRWCYWTHVINEGREWGITQREVAREILSNEEKKSVEQIGKWQDLLEAYEVIKRVREASKGRNSRGYLWIWKGGARVTDCAEG